MHSKGLKRSTSDGPCEVAENINAQKNRLLLQEGTPPAPSRKNYEESALLNVGVLPVGAQEISSNRERTRERRKKKRSKKWCDCKKEKKKTVHVQRFEDITTNRMGTLPGTVEKFIK